MSLSQARSMHSRIAEAIRLNKEITKGHIDRKRLRDELSISTHPLSSKHTLFGVAEIWSYLSMGLCVSHVYRDAKRHALQAMFSTESFVTFCCEGLMA